ncbi:hypothetical protein [Flavobacterium algicola]|uniref:hypothetical protein n=1 Tax=Flavobacterium algicola TaxID=556529 RepID=UPI001EFE9DD6|nr:hypothetical protein [Flavobacterium algicola]MCG9791010.1 hypothetical protein [Flavobacterium algicola]
MSIAQKKSILKTYSLHRLYLLTLFFVLTSFCSLAKSVSSPPIDSTAIKERLELQLMAEFTNNPIVTSYETKRDTVLSKKVIYEEKINSIVTYKIYHDGTINKIIPSLIAKQFENKYRYIYVDSKGYKHNLGDFTIHRTQVYRGEPGEMINLIDLEEVPKSYKKGTHQYHFIMDSPRSFVNEQTLASFFGAMLEVNYLDIGCNGFSHEDGSSRPSRSHINGINGDFKYLRTDKSIECGSGTSLNLIKEPQALDFDRQNKWNDALYKFGWKGMLGWTVTIDNETKYLNNITHKTSNHYHHLHVQEYEPEINEIQQ